MGPVMCNIFISYLGDFMECILIKFVGTRLRKTRPCHSQGLRQAGGMGRQQPHEIQQRKTHGPASGLD